VRVCSLNLRSGLYRNYSKISSWMETNEIEVLLSQDPFRSYDKDFVFDLSLVSAGGNEKVFTLHRGDNKQIDILKEKQFSQYLIINDILFVNLYLNPSGKKSIRAKEMEQINSHIDEILSSNKYPIVIVGDFNLAPNPEDGLYGDKISKWNSKTDRKPFFDLLENHNLVDIGNTIHREFTFERKNRGKLSRFRCDLCLASESILNEIQFRYDHSVRKGDSTFTDHSALVIDVLTDEI